MTDENNQTVAPKEHEIADLQSLLRKKMGEDLVVERHTAIDLLPPGENYGSLILKVDAVIKRDAKSNDDEELHLIAKIPPATQQQRDFFDSPFTFKKESFMYDTIIPRYKKFERDCGIDEADVFDVGPEFYGSRLSLGDGEDFDDNAVILMENLKVRGYYTGDRYVGLDLDHSRLAVIAMARFHALGMAMKIKDPEFFEVLKVRSKCLELTNPDEWVEAMNVMYKTIEEDSIVGVHYEKCMTAMKTGSGSECWVAVPEEPWSTIIHADFWVNNIMFHRDRSNGRPDDVKFVDFQNYLFLSPVRELTFFLGSGVNHEVGTNHVEELIDLYHETLVERLEIMDCDTRPYARDKFDERVLKDAYIEFSHSAFMLKIITKKVDVDDPESRNVKSAMVTKGSEMFYVRIRDLVNGYVKRGWL